MDDAAQPHAAFPTDPSTKLVEVRLSDLPPGTVDFVYRQLLVPAFRPEELISLEELQAAYGPTGSDPSIVVMAGGRPVAVMLGEWYVERHVLLLCYLSVDR
ncbi:hypothetical protein PU560_10695, partial [Georgenia sp. 10Sc9-8]|nr:hypothetical protein [Georgenia halotolerans]